MDDITKMFDQMTKNETYADVAARANVSRSTVANLRLDPERRTLQVLRRVAEAMGYQVIITIKRNGGVKV